MLSAQVSLYPQKTTRASEIINESIQSLDRTVVKYEVGPISTQIHGSDEQVWSSLKTLYSKACSAGEVNMVVTFSNSAT